MLHGDLDSIEQPPVDQFPLSLLSLPRVLQRPHPAGLRYILLGRSIWENVPPKFQTALGSVGIIDHPYHFPPLRPVTSASLVFGIFGNTGYGYGLEDIARAVKAVHPEVSFRLIGFFADPATVDRLKPLVDDAGHLPISRETFVERAHGITHALWLGASRPLPPARQRDVLRRAGLCEAARLHHQLIYRLLL